METNTIIIISVVAVVLIIIFIAAGVSNSRKNRNSGGSSSGGSALNDKPGPVNTATSSKKINYEPMIEIARIITSNDLPTVNKIKLLASDYKSFVETHQAWCNSVYKTVNSNDKDVLIRHFFANWLKGHSAGRSSETNPSGIYACYVAGKEVPKSVLTRLEQINRHLDYDLKLMDLPLSGIENVTQLIPMVETALAHKRYSLISFEPDAVNPRGFYLFIVPIKDHERIISAAGKVDFKIYRQILL